MLKNEYSNLFFGVAHSDRVCPGMCHHTARDLQHSLPTRHSGGVQQLRASVEQAVDVVEPGRVQVVNLVTDLDVGLQHRGAVQDPHPAPGDLRED